ncbi:MAG TPA: cell division protein FtsQ/DivIB [Usitatibacter sp.]|nr:cell division protein FtsQ/DivIB [Usitatibacter sp.]
MSLHPVLRHRVLPGLAAGGVASLLVAGSWYGYTALADRPVAAVVFSGDVDRLPPQIVAEFARELKRRTVGTSLASVRENAKRIPWVRDASVRRRYPATIEVRFEAHRALARWNDDRLVSPEGEIFAAESPAELPRFHGADSAAPAIVRAWPDLVRWLAPAGAVTEVTLTPRATWEVALASGLHVALGRDEVQARAQRFAAAWPQLVARGIETKYADLRYPNGFALRQAAVQAPVTASKKKR